MMDRLEVRVSITKLLLALLIVIVPLSILGLFLTQHSDKTLDNAVGANFKTMAQLYATQVTQFIRERVTDAGQLASNPATVAAASAPVTTKNQNPNPMDANASALLRQHKALDPRFLSIVVTNGAGNVVAASQRPSQMSYAQSALWQSVYNNGQGATKISDIVDDTLSKSYYVSIGVPVTDQAGQTVGVLNAAVNVSDVLSPFRQDNIGSGARVALVNDNGTIVSGPNADVFARLRSQGFDYVHDALGANQGSRNGWVMADINGADHIVGYAGTGLKQHFSNMGWIVTVTQEEHAAAAPIRQLERFAIGMVVLALLMLTLLCVYYYLHRAQRYAHIGEEEEAPAEQARGTAASARL